MAQRLHFTQFIFLQAEIGVVSRDKECHWRLHVFDIPITQNRTTRIAATFDFVHVGMLIYYIPGIIVVNWFINDSFEVLEGFWRVMQIEENLKHSEEKLLTDYQNEFLENTSVSTRDLETPWERDVTYTQTIFFICVN